MPPGCEIFECDDLTEPAMARDAADGMDAVLHTASVFRLCDDMEEELVRPNIAVRSAPSSPRHHPPQPSSYISPSSLNPIRELGSSPSRWSARAPRRARASC